MTKTLQTLYKIDTKGKLREWTMHIDGASFYAVKGLVDGKKTQRQGHNHNRQECWAK